MFLRIRLLEEDRRFHGFVWSFEKGQAHRMYQFLSHVFGNAGSPVVANFVVKEQALKFKDKHSLAFLLVHQSMLVEAVVDSVRSEEEARETIRQIVKLHTEAGMQLCKWASNSEYALHDLALDQREKSVELASTPNQKEGEFPMIKTLGLIWQTADDFFRFEQTLPSLNTINYLD